MKRVGLSLLFFLIFSGEKCREEPATVYPSIHGAWLPADYESSTENGRGVLHGCWCDEDGDFGFTWAPDKYCGGN